MAQVFTPEPADTKAAFWAASVGAEWFDGGRVAFVDSDYEPTTEWRQTTVKVARIVSTFIIETRRADCGSGCKCAAEFRVTDEMLEIN